jgi:hypothetical protein
LEHGRRQCSVIAASKGILLSIMHLTRRSRFGIRGSLVGILLWCTSSLMADAVEKVFLHRRSKFLLAVRAIFV